MVGVVAQVRRSGERFTTRGEGLTSRHSFSFGAHYDPGNVAHAVLVAHNEDVVAPGRGYDEHAHADLEIVTWVLEGSLVHEDSRGNRGVVHPGLVQRLSAGSGVLHSETSDATATRFVQMWLRPDEGGLEPSYAQHDVSACLDAGGLVPLVGPDGAVRIHTSGAALYVARLTHGQQVALPEAPHLHVFVARGAVDLEGAGRLEEGDAVRFTGAGGPWLSGAGPAEVLVWRMP